MALPTAAFSGTCLFAVFISLYYYHLQTAVYATMRPMNEHDKREILSAIESARDGVTKAGHAQAQKTKDLIRRMFEQTFGEHAALLAEIERIATAHPITVVVSGQSIHIPGLQAFQGEDMSYTVARDHTDEAFTLDPITVSDSEGPVEKAFTETFESDSPDVVSIDSTAGTLHFGTFGGANLTRKVTIDGQEFIVATAVFNVTPGALTVSGNINVPGLTPDA